MPVFVETAGRSWRQTALVCTVFSVGDAVLVLIIYGAGEEMRTLLFALRSDLEERTESHLIAEN